MTEAQDTNKCYVFRLYNADRSAETMALARRLEDAVFAQLGETCRVETVDILTEPERAVEGGVFVTPTLVREMPEPIKRVVGDLSEPGKVLVLLGMVMLDQKA